MKNKETEFLNVDDEFKFIKPDGAYETILLASGMLAFTYCQIPFVYEIAQQAKLVVTDVKGDTFEVETLTLSTELSDKIFARRGEIKQVKVCVPSDMLFKVEE